MENKPYNISVKQLKAMVRFMKDQGVAEFQWGGMTVKFKHEVKFPSSAVPIGEGGELLQSGGIDDLKNSIETRLEPRDPRKSEEDFEKNLMWSV